MYDIAYTNALIQRGIDKGTLPNKLYKYREVNKRTIQIIKKLHFYFASPSSFNDPFDCNLFYKQEYTKAEREKVLQEFEANNPPIRLKEIKKHIGSGGHKFYEFYSEKNKIMVENCGILSLSKTHKNITMWSHYANNHKGIVFELKVEKDLDFFNLFGIVKYKEEEYELLSFTSKNKDLEELFFTKYKDWTYEEEIRIVDYAKNGLRKFKKEVLSTIIFGCKSNEKLIKAIIKLCHKLALNHIEFKKAKMIPGKFALDFETLDKSKYL